jgi:hypothetical protein
MLLKFSPKFSYGITAMTMAFIYFKAYTSQEYNYSLFIFTIWGLISAFIAYFEYSALAASVMASYVTIYYLTLRFNQISLELKQIEKKRFMRLLELIEEHNILSVYTKKCNIWFSLAMGVIYLLMTVAINLSIYLSIYGNLSKTLRLGMMNSSILILIIMLLMTYTSGKLSTEAHKAYKTINSTFVRINFPLFIKLKVFIIV